MASPEKTLIIVGPSSSGKDTIVDRIATMTGAEVVSTSDQVRKLAQESGLVNPTRNDLQQFANSMRQQYGEDLFARLASKEASNKKNKLLIINGIRNPAEIDTFPNAIVIGVDASKETRFKRTLKRSKPSDPKNWQDFLICDQLEEGTVDGKKGQQNLQCLSRADIIIKNETDSIDELEYCVDTLTDNLIHQKNIVLFPRFIDIKPSEIQTPKKIIVMNGPHGAGKTTIAKLLSPKNGIEFAHEIGGKLRQEVSYNSLESGVDFDREVMRREILRDHQLIRDKNSDIHIVETWHTGNIAYAAERSPEFISTYQQEFEKQLKKFSVIHVLVNIGDSTFIARVTEKVPENQKTELLDFYKRIISYTKSLYSRYNLEFTEVDNSDDISIAEEIITRKIKTHNF